MTLTAEELAVIEDTVTESERLNTPRAGPELARQLADELRQELINRHKAEKRAK